MTGVSLSFSTELKDEVRDRERLGLEPVQKLFADIANMSWEDFCCDLAAGMGKKIYMDYISMIEHYLIAKHETLRFLRRLLNRQSDIAAREFEKVLGRTGKLLFGN